MNSNIIDTIANVIAEGSDFKAGDFFVAMGKAYEIHKMIRARMEKAITENGGNYIVCDIMRAFDNE